MHIFCANVLASCCRRAVQHGVGWSGKHNTIQTHMINNHILVFLNVKMQRWKTSVVLSACLYIVPGLSSDCELCHVSCNHDESFYQSVNKTYINKWTLRCTICCSVSFFCLLINRMRGEYPYMSRHAGQSHSNTYTSENKTNQNLLNAHMNDHSELMLPTRWQTQMQTQVDLSLYIYTWIYKYVNELVHFCRIRLLTRMFKEAHKVPHTEFEFNLPFPTKIMIINQFAGTCKAWWTSMIATHMWQLALSAWLDCARCVPQFRSCGRWLHPSMSLYLLISAYREFDNIHTYIYARYAIASRNPTALVKTYKLDWVDLTDWIAWIG